MRLPLLIMLVVAGGCGSPETDELPLSDCLSPNRVVADRCLEPGVQDDGCPAGTLGLEDGSCQPAGIPSELCGEGFESDGAMGCEPVLPPEPCPAGQMAVPGESTCHAVMECGAGQWGDIPVDATTVYVDAFYPGIDSDGSSAKPFTTISDAVAAAAPDSLIAVAAGSYLEDVVIQNKAVRLWGKCPDEVELRGTGASLAALVVREGASGTEVHGLALSGASIGFGVSGAEGVLVDRVWVHDAIGRGVDVESVLGPTSVTVRGSLVEQNHEYGVFVMGADATLEGLVVRGTLPQASNQLYGRGINIQLFCAGAVCDPARRSTVFVRGSVVEQNHEIGVVVDGSDATLEGVLVRDTLPRASDQQYGHGIGVQPACTEAACNPATRSNAVVRGSVIERNHDMGVFVMSSDATLEGLVIRGTLPQASDQLGGRGINIQLGCSVAGCDPTMRASALVRSSLVEQNHEFGARVVGSDATFEGVVVRGTQPPPGDLRVGLGIGVQHVCTEAGCDPATRASALVRGSLVEQNHQFGVLVGGADVTLEGLLVRGTVARQSDGLYGDGVAVFSQEAPTSGTVTSSRIEASARAGLANFGATVALGASALSCNAFELAGETYLEQPFRFENVGGNACGCPVPALACKAQSVGLEPPEPITDRP